MRFDTVLCVALSLGGASAFQPVRLPALRPSSVRPQAQLAAPRGLKNRVAPRAAMQDMSHDAWEWLANLGAPSALVAGAALASFYDLKSDLNPRDGDKPWVAIIKKAAVVLFVSAFALEISCVFVTTVTGTLLQGSVVNGVASSTVALMNRELEFEFLAARITFFQGLLNWLAAVGLHAIVPKEGAEKPFNSLSLSEKAERRQQLMSGSAIAAMTLMMLAFYNGHMAGAYSNYPSMILRLFSLTFHRYLFPVPRVVPLIALVPVACMLFNGYKAFRGEVAERVGGGFKRRTASKMGFTFQEPWVNDRDTF